MRLGGRIAAIRGEQRRKHRWVGQQEDATRVEQDGVEGAHIEFRHPGTIPSEALSISLSLCAAPEISSSHWPSEPPNPFARFRFVRAG